MEFSDAPARTPAQPRISLRDHADYVSLTMEFRCNLACVHCMIEGTMDRLTPSRRANSRRSSTNSAATGGGRG